MKLLRRYYLCFLLLTSTAAVSHPLLEQLESTHKTDPAAAVTSLQDVAYSSLNELDKLRYSYILVSSHNLQGKYDVSMRWIESHALPVATDTKTLSLMFDYSIRAAWPYEATQDYDTSLLWYQQAEALSIQLKDKEKQGYVYLQYGAVADLKGERYQALKQTKQAHQLLAGSKDAAMIADLNSQLGILYYLSGDYQNAINFQNKVLDQAIKDDSKQEIAVAHYNLANATYKWSVSEHNQKRANRAVQHYLKSLQIAREIEANYIQRNNLLGLISLYTHYGYIAEASESIAELSELDVSYSGYSLLSYNLVLAQYFHKIGDLSSLKHYLHEATLYFSSAETALPTYAITKQREIAELYASLDDHERAYSWLEKYSSKVIGRYESQTQAKIKALQSEIENQRLVDENQELNDSANLGKAVSLITLIVTLFSLVLLHHQRKKKKLFYQLSHTDFLTGVSNRRHIFEVGEKDFKRNKLAAIIFDLDHFKKLNDTYGHEFGDDILKGVSQIVSNNVREQDVVGRIGGEEFLILLPNIDGKELRQVAERVRFKIAQHRFVVPTGDTLQVTASFGVTQHVGTALSDMVNIADGALYQAKETGRNACVSVN